jgi:predicted signal transduction protein with EAL and GGDEF domain
MREPFNFEGHSFVVGASIGIAMFPEDGNDADALLRNADAAMYAAKAAGRNSFRFFRESMNEEAVRSVRLEQGLRRAIDEGGLSLHYQPVVDVENGSVVAVEALARWVSAEFGPVPPNEFVPLAEEVGLIDALGEWVLREACRQQRAWLDAGLDPVRMAVNVSSRQLVRQNFADEVEAILREFDLDPTGFELEITESALMDEAPEMLETLRAIKDVGVRLALDDFGTGYSSLSRLFRFPIDTIKIDQSFVREIGSETKPDAIIAAVLAMARRLGLAVTAEGVETEAQEAFLRREGCDLFQGYLFARPLDPDQIPAFLRRRRGS